MLAELHPIVNASDYKRATERFLELACDGNEWVHWNEELVGLGELLSGHPFASEDDRKKISDLVWAYETYFDEMADEYVVNTALKIKNYYHGKN